jgi:hypothetical protein
MFGYGNVLSQMGANLASPGYRQPYNPYHALLPMLPHLVNMGQRYPSSGFGLDGGLMSMGAGLNNNSMGPQYAPQMFRRQTPRLFQPIIPWWG